MNDIHVHKQSQVSQSVIVWLRPVTEAPRGRPSPPLGCGGEWKETGKNWWVGIRAV